MSQLDHENGDDARPDMDASATLRPATHPQNEYRVDLMEALARYIDQGLAHQLVNSHRQQNQRRISVTVDRPTFDEIRRQVEHERTATQPRVWFPKRGFPRQRRT